MDFSYANYFQVREITDHNIFPAEEKEKIIRRMHYQGLMIDPPFFETTTLSYL